MTDTSADAQAATPAATSSGGVAAYALVLCTALADLYIASSWLLGHYPTLTALGYHIAAAVCYALVARVALRNGSAEILINLGTLVLLGPLGGVVLFLLEVNAGAEPGNLDNRRDVLRQGPPPTPSQALHLDIRQNRRPLLNGRLPDSFIRILDTGTITEQYRVIATISRHYTPEMLPALRHALASPIPVLRVQAAAVFAKLRGEFSERADWLLKSATAPQTREAIEARTRELRAVAQSGFIDQELAANLLGREGALRTRLGTPGDFHCGEQDDNRPVAGFDVIRLGPPGRFKGAG